RRPAISLGAQRCCEDVGGIVERARRALHRFPDSRPARHEPDELRHVGNWLRAGGNASAEIAQAIRGDTDAAWRLPAGTYQQPTRTDDHRAGAATWLRNTRLSHESSRDVWGNPAGFSAGCNLVWRTRTFDGESRAEDRIGERPDQSRDDADVDFLRRLLLVRTLSGDHPAIHQSAAVDGIERFLAGDHPPRRIVALTGAADCSAGDLGRCELWAGAEVVPVELGKTKTTHHRDTEARRIQYHKSTSYTDDRITLVHRSSENWVLRKEVSLP